MNFNEIAKQLLEGSYLEQPFSQTLKHFSLAKSGDQASSKEQIPASDFLTKSMDKPVLAVKSSMNSTLDLPFIKKPVKIKEKVGSSKTAYNFDQVLANHYRIQQKMQQQQQLNSIYPHVRQEQQNKFSNGFFINRRTSQQKAQSEDQDDSKSHQIIQSPLSIDRQANSNYQNFLLEENAYESLDKPYQTSSAKKESLNYTQCFANTHLYPKSEDRVRQRKIPVNVDSTQLVQTNDPHMDFGKINVIIDDSECENDRSLNIANMKMFSGLASLKTEDRMIASQKHDTKGSHKTNMKNEMNNQLYHFIDNKYQKKGNGHSRLSEYYKKIAGASRLTDASSRDDQSKEMLSYTDMSFNQLASDAANFYNTLKNSQGANIDFTESGGASCKQNSEDMYQQKEDPGRRKGFKIKLKTNSGIGSASDSFSATVPKSIFGIAETPDNANQVAQTKRTESQIQTQYSKRDRQSSSISGVDKCALEMQHFNFIEQIRKKFSEQKYMKREDVLKLLKQIQAQTENAERIKQKIFDQSDAFKGLVFNQVDQRTFNLTHQQQQFMNLFKQNQKAARQILDPKQKRNSYQAHTNSSSNKNGRKMSPESQMNQIKFSRLGNTQKFNTNVIQKEELAHMGYAMPVHHSTKKHANRSNMKSANDTFNEGSSILHISRLKALNKIGEEMRNTDEDERTLGEVEDNELMLNEDELNDLNAMLQIGLKSLQKFENKSDSNQQRSRSQLQNNSTSYGQNSSAFCTAWGAISLYNGMDPKKAQAFMEMLRNEKLGLLSNDVDQLKKELQEYYIKEKLARGCISKQMSLHSRYPNCASPQKPLQQQKSMTAGANIRSKAIPPPVFNPNSLMSQKDDSYTELKQINGIIDGCHQNNHANMAETKIKVNLVPHAHLENSEINRVIRRVNHFVFLVFKQRAKLNEKQYISLFRFFNIKPPIVNGMLDQSAFKHREFMNQANEKLLHKLYKVFNTENGGVEPLIGKSNLNYYVGKGNNYYLVKQVIKRRIWWTRATKEDFASNVSESDDKIHYGCNFIWTQWKKNKHINFLKNNSGDGSLKLYNRLEDNYHLSNKKALFRNIVQYYRAEGLDPFQIAIPLTFHIRQMSTTDKDYQQFLREFNTLKREKECQNVWIIKPGEDTNRGSGIQVTNSLDEVQGILRAELGRKGGRTMIVQKYIEKPLLINNRKFDIRCYALLVSVNGFQKGFFYRDCYFRTSSKEYSIENLGNKYIHLTNDAIQKNSEDYGKFENGNKLSINDFQRYLDQHFGPLSINFMRDIFSQIERLVTDTFRAVFGKIDPNRVRNCFELFGYDFMIDEDFRVYLIEANTNPCLEISCPLLARIIPEVVDNTFTIAMDPLFQPGQFQNRTDEHFESNGFGAVSSRTKKRSRRMDLLPQIKFQMVFDERVDGQGILEKRRKYLAESKEDEIEGGGGEFEGEQSMEVEEEVADEDDTDDNYYV